MVMTMMITIANRYEYREAAAERNCDEQAGNNSFHHLSPGVGQ
jgi:hypothetical protein